jgi:hypothetical protein
MKIKYNSAKTTFSIKGITATEFAVINALMSHVRLGMCDAGSDIAFDFCEQVEGLDLADDNGCTELVLPEVTLIAEPMESYDNMTVILQDPTLEVYVD